MTSLVIAGLDPAIHAAQPNLRRASIEPRVIGERSDAVLSNGYARG
jgi:hypothetical protein